MAAFPRFAPRFAILDVIDTTDEAYVWLAIFEGDSELTVLWPGVVSGGVRKSGLSLLGIPRTRIR